MNKIELAALRVSVTDKRKALALALIAAVREQGASMEDLQWAYNAVHHEMGNALSAKVLTEFIDDIEAAFKDI